MGTRNCCLLAKYNEPKQILTGMKIMAKKTTGMNWSQSIPLTSTSNRKKIAELVDVIIG